MVEILEIMVDKDTEICFEQSAALLTNEGYFARYRVHLATMTCRVAWETVESEMPLGLTRFSTYDSFKKALRRERGNNLPAQVRLTIK